MVSVFIVAAGLSVLLLLTASALDRFYPHASFRLKLILGLMFGIGGIALIFYVVPIPFFVALPAALLFTAAAYRTFSLPPTPQRQLL